MKVYRVLDGISVKTNNPDEARKIVERHGKHFKMSWEEEQFKKMFIKDVNNFLNIKINGSIKKKGLFVTDPDIGNGCNNLIIPKALEAYFVKQIPIREFIKNHQNIYDFCASQKVDKSYEIYWNNQKQQRLNRYYVSTKRAYLYKRRRGSDENMLKGWGVQLFNNFKELPINEYNIDYKYYIQQCEEIISIIENKNTLF